MNTLILLAVSGVIMMFSGILLQSRSAIRTVAHVLLLLAIIVNILELRGIDFVHINTQGLMSFDRFAVLFSLVANSCTFAFFLLSSKDMEKVGKKEQPEDPALLVVGQLECIKRLDGKRMIRRE